MNKRKHALTIIIIIALMMNFICLGLSRPVYAQGRQLTDVKIQNKDEVNKNMLSSLNVSGTKLVNEEGKEIQLKGLSTHGIAWFPQYINSNLFAQFKNNFGINVIRLAMYSDEYHGYCSGGDKAYLKNLIDQGVKYAAENNMYVIIDWHSLHDNNPNTYKDQAKAFFEEMSSKYAGYKNVIYEICNEPNGNTTWDQVKSYAQEIIPIIRKNCPDSVILVGTPNWSQDVDKAADNPIKGYKNIMYTLHFYAATHKDELRNKMINAVNKGLPIFVSEFGVCDASGNGAIDKDQAAKWIDMLNQYKISYVMWNISNKNETSAIFKSSTNKAENFTTEDLSDSGRWFLNMMTGR